MTEGHGRIIGMFMGCHRAPGKLGVAITVCTTWIWRWFKPAAVATHSSVGFIYQDGYREIFEAREPKNWQGPIPVDRVLAWVNRKKGRRFTMYDIPTYLLDARAAERKHGRCMALLQIWTYSVAQLPRMGIRKWLPFLPINTTPNAVVCSEGATLILGPEVGVCALTGKKKADLVTPFDYEQAAKAICAKPRHHIADTSNEYRD